MFFSRWGEEEEWTFSLNLNICIELEGDRWWIVKGRYNNDSLEHEKAN